MVTIIEANTKRLRKQFVQFQNDLYKDCPQYVPTMLSDEMANLDPKKNPAFEYCEMKLWLAMRDGNIVGRVGGIISHKANEIWDRKRVRITRLDFIDDMEVSRALIDTVQAWGKEKGMTEISGPLGTCDMDKEGMLVDGFDKQSMFITYYNYPYYVEHMEKLAFEKDVDWLEHKVYVDSANEEKLARICDRVMKRGGFKSIRVKSRREVMPYVDKIFDLINSEYEKLYGVVPVTQKQKDYYRGQFLILLNLDYIGLIENDAGELVAMGILAPSLADAMTKCGGKLFPFGWVGLLKAIRKPKVLDMYFIAVDSRFRNAGLSAVIMHELTARAQKNGVIYAETGPQLEENFNIQKLFGAYKADREHKRRRCWKKTIDV